MLICALLAGCDRNTTVTTASMPALKSTNTATAPTGKSGYHFQSADTQALQDDPFANPGMLWVDRGEELWGSSSQGEQPSCQSCHSDEATDMTGVAAQYPRFNKHLNAVVNLEGQINHCRVEHQQAAPLAYESEDLLSLSAYVGHQSKGLPVEVVIDGPAASAFASGQTYFYTRRGQLNLACNHCHEDNVGRMLRGDKLSQGQVGGYPAYRLEWQTLGSLHRRLRFCNTGVRAEPFEYGAMQYIELELYLKWRAQGLPVETPAVRR